MLKKNQKSRTKSPLQRPSAARMVGLAVLILLPLAGVALVLADWWTVLPQGEVATYVGRKSCIECHRPQYEQWHGSPHDKAMDLATAETVLGDFDDALLVHYGVKSRMFRRDGRYFVHTEGPTGEMADFEVKYVFGVEPLQQYMVEVNRPQDLPEEEISRVQVLPIVWDTERKEWYYLDPPDVHEKLAPDDRLHWTGMGQNWNRMCADCHSTNLQKNFNDQTGQYHTTYNEIDVSCETCHGPGSTHVKLARANSLFWDRNLGYGLPRLKGEDHHAEIESCARCHMRRQRVVAPGHEPGKPLDDYLMHALISPGLYHSDGQIQDEVYVYGSFLQSKMYHEGIRCSDCHNPHTTKLKHEGNKLCTSCHTHPEAKYDTPAHHHHKAGSKGAQCVECHMPESTYMEVDPRRDHSLRVPRPDLSVRLGTPNACTRCHIDSEKLGMDARGELSKAHVRDGQHDYAAWMRAAREAEDESVRKEIRQELKRLDEWSRKHTRQWYGDKTEKLPHYAVALEAARRAMEDPSDQLGQRAEEELVKVVRDGRFPPIARASALVHLLPYESAATEEAISSSLQDKSSQVRFAALGYYEDRINSLAQTAGEARQQSDDMARAIAMLKDQNPRGAQIMDQQRRQVSAYAAQLRQQLDSMAQRPAKLLSDPSRLVRSEAGRILAAVPGELLTDQQRTGRKKAIAEYKTGLMADNDWALSHHSLGLLEERLARRGDGYAAAIKSYRRAIDVEGDVTGPRSNLAQVLERQADATASEKEAAKLLAEVRRLREQESELLGREAKLLPDSAELQYRYGLSLYLIGKEKEAADVLLKAHRLAPHSADILLQLALLYKKRQDWKFAIAAMRKLVQMQPENKMFRHVLQETIQESNASGQPAPPPPREDRSN